MTNKSKIILEKIIVAPDYFLLADYFSRSEKSFINWKNRELDRIEKKYGSKCILKIKQLKVPVSKVEEDQMKKKLPEREYKQWDKNQFKCFLAFFELGDIARSQKAFYYSFFIYLISYFEHNLNKICLDYYKKHIQTLKLKDLAGTGLNRALNYMEKVCNFKLPNKIPINELLLMRDIRNCLAHAGGEINDEKLLKSLAKEKKLKILNEDDVKSLYFESAYCREGIKKIEKFTRILIRKNRGHLWNWQFSVLNFRPRCIIRR